MPGRGTPRFSSEMAMPAWKPFDRLGGQLSFVTWDRDIPTGGNVYNQNLVTELRALDVHTQLHALAGPWPEGDASSHTQLARALREAPVSLVDGIVACGAPDVITAAVDSGHMIILVLHLPISDELGLEPSQRERYPALEARAVQAASGVLCSSRWSAARLSGRFGRRDVGVAVPGVRSAAVAQGSQHTGHPHFLTVASLTPTKDQLTLVRALALIADLPWTAALVGSDEAAPTYAAQVRGEIASAGLAERISVPGLLAGDALNREWDAADLFVLPSRTETYGLVIGEALARGIPAVVPAGTGAVEALAQATSSRSDQLPGTAIPPSDPAGMAALLRSWLTEPALRHAWRQGALARRDTLPGWRHTAEAVLAYLERPQNAASTRAGSPPGSPPTPPPASPPSTRSSPS
jgi:glycosyltransferase involved in cell wall biosynthesis